MYCWQPYTKTHRFTDRVNCLQMAPVHWWFFHGTQERHESTSDQWLGTTQLQRRSSHRYWWQS